MAKRRNNASRKSRKGTRKNTRRNNMMRKRRMMYGGQSAPGSVSMNEMKPMMDQSLAQGRQFESYHANQHGGFWASATEMANRQAAVSAMADRQAAAMNARAAAADAAAASRPPPPTAAQMSGAAERAAAMSARASIPMPSAAQMATFAARDRAMRGGFWATRSLPPSNIPVPPSLGSAPAMASRAAIAPPMPTAAGMAGRGAAITPTNLPPIISAPPQPQGGPNLGIPMMKPPTMNLPPPTMRGGQNNVPPTPVGMNTKVPMNLPAAAHTAMKGGKSRRNRRAKRGGALEGAPFPGAVEAPYILPEALRASARMLPLDQDYTQIANLRDQDGGKRKGRKGSRKSKKNTRKASRKGRKASRKNRKYVKRGGAYDLAMASPYGAPTMLLSSAEEAKALGGMNTEWKLAEDPMAFAPGYSKE